MSIVICAGVPRAPLVDSHHLHEPVPEAKASSPARGLCYHLQAEQYTMRAANHLKPISPLVARLHVLVTIALQFESFFPSITFREGGGEYLIMH